MTGNEWTKGVREQVLMRRMEGGSGFPLSLWQSIEGWWLVCDFFLMARAVKNKEGFVIQGVSVCTVIATMHMKLWEHVSF